MPSSREAAIKAPSDLMSLKCWLSGLNRPVRIRTLFSVLQVDYTPKVQVINAAI